jgi:hypothetical protein
MGNPRAVDVFASSGGAQVRTATGFLVASLNPGTRLAFTPQTGAATSMQLTGVVEFADGKYFLTDTTTNTRVELRGPDVAKFKGKTVQVTGSVILGAAAAGGASEVVQVNKIEQKGKAVAGKVGAGAGAAGAGAAGAAAGGAAAAAGGATVLGMGVATAAVVGGAVVAGGVVAGLKYQHTI